MNWYYAEAGKQAGPVTDEQLAELVRSHVVTDDTLVWHEGMANWVPYRTTRDPAAAPETTATPETAQAAAVTSRPTCARCGRTYYLAGSLKPGETPICPSCLQDPSGTMPSAGLSADVHYGGFWIRFAAKLIDNLIVGGVIMIPMIVLIFVLLAGSASASSGPDSAAFGILVNLISLAAQLVFLAINVAYITFFLGKYGATPGKMICGLKVINADGTRVSYGKAFGRGAADFLSQITCNIGYLIAAFDGEKRALHDHICSTRVVYK